MKLHSFRLRLTLWHVAVLALVLAGFGTALCCSLRASLAASVDRDLAERAHSLAARWFGYPRHPFPSPPPQAERQPFGGSKVERRGYFRRPRVLNLDGYSMVPFLDDEPWDPATFVLSVAGAEHYSTIPVDNELVRVFSAPLRRSAEGKVEGVVQFAHLLTEQKRLNDGLVRTLLTLIPLALLVAGLGGAFLTDRALRPVRQLTQAAAQIGAEDLSRRLEVTGKDELSALATTFNGMIGRLEEAFRRLETAYEQQRRFTADASHELRTPLTTIKANTSLALASSPSPEEYREALRAADQAADTMDRIVQDLLLLARSDGGQLSLELRPVPIHAVLQRAASVVQSQENPPIRLELPNAVMGGKGVIRKKAGPDPLFPRGKHPVSGPAIGVLGDAHHLLRLFVNLLDNAVRHTPPQGCVVVEARNEGNGSVLVRVRDTGEGIPAEHLPHVCERFYRVDAARAHCARPLGVGAGLGLAICQSIVQAHGGTLSLESEVGRGTTVTVTLPHAELMEESPPALPAKKVPDAAPSARPSSSE